MPRLSALIARLEDWLAPKCGNGFHRLERIGKQQSERLKRRGQIWYATHKKRLGRYIVLGLLAGYFYGMFLNSVQLGTAGTGKEEDETIQFAEAGLDSSSVRLPEYFCPSRTMMISTVSPTWQF